MYIIDWEYAGMAPRYYDIADMFQEILVPRDSEKSIVAEYCAGDNFDRTLFFIDLFKHLLNISQVTNLCDQGVKGNQS